MNGQKKIVLMQKNTFSWKLLELMIRNDYSFLIRIRFIFLCFKHSVSDQKVSLKLAASNIQTLYYVVRNIYK